MISSPTVHHIIKGLGPGGAERLLVSQLEHSATADTTTVTYLRRDKDHLVPDIAATGANVYRIPLESRQWPLQLRRHLKEVNSDVVHVHSPAVAVVVRLLVITLPVHQRPVVIGTEHNRWPRLHWLTRLANRCTISRQAATIAVSSDVASTVSGTPPGRLRTVLHGISLDAVRREADRDAVRAELEIGANETTAITVANFRTEKALDDLVAAAALAVNQEPSLRFFLVGQGPLASEVSAWVNDANLGDRFTILGYRQDVGRLLSGADFFTLTSHHEGTPVAIMEALAAGLPVIATAAGGIPEAIGDAGRTIPVGDVSALADAYVNFVNDDQQRQAWIDATASQAERFDITRSINEIEQIYAASSATVGSKRRRTPSA